MTTKDQLPQLPDGVVLEDLLIPLRAALNTCHDTDWSLRQFKTHISHALDALAQQTQGNPVGEVYSIQCGRNQDAYACIRIFNSAGANSVWDLPIREGGMLYTTPQPQPAPLAG